MLLAKFSTGSYRTSLKRVRRHAEYPIHLYWTMGPTSADFKLSNYRMAIYGTLSSMYPRSRLDYDELVCL